MKPVKVTQLNKYIKQILISDPILTNISVIGEISNIKYHGSGHVYFSLKDETSRINCFLSSDVLKKIRYELEDGMEIEAYGYVSVYERGGSYSLNIKGIELTGKGDLAIAFEKLKKKLSEEGIFDESHKKSIPFFPKRVAVVTSETGAAVRDILKIIKSRNDIVDILIYPVLVQGPMAAPSIVKAIEDLNRIYDDIDVMIVGRSGGSIEELWAFNEESVARAIYASGIPVISAVGHETDFTISDFAADRRAETPTAAAAMAVPDTDELRKYTASLKDNLLRMLKNSFNYKSRLIESGSPETMLRILKHRIEVSRLKALSAYKQLCDLDPLNIMQRGFAAVTDENGSFIRSAEELHKGSRFRAVMKDGIITAEVLDTEGRIK